MNPRHWLLLALAACAGSSSSAPPAQPAPAPQPAPYYGGYPPPQPGYPPAPAPYAQPAPAPTPYYPPAPAPGPTAAPAAPPSSPAPSAQRPLLPPLYGALAWQAEARAIIAELVTNLSTTNQQRVRGIPIVFDPNPNEVNAFAGCDEKGSPFIAGTEGLLEAVDAIAQTKATDEMLGTQTYEQYVGAVAPQMAKSDKASAALPMGIIPAQVALDPRRLSRAREIWDDIIAFTFGHEMGHHYLGHTGCANGQPMGLGPNPVLLGQIATSILPGLNQPNEVAADAAGCINVLDTGKARQPKFRWTEAGGLMLLDFFSRIERAAGISPLNPIGFLRSHPNPTFRIPLVQAVARTWWMQHPG